MTLTFINKTKNSNSFTIPELNVDTGLLKPGQQAVLTFDVPKKDTIYKAISKSENFDPENAFVITVGTGGEEAQQELPPELQEEQ